MKQVAKIVTLSWFIIMSLTGYGQDDGSGSGTVDISVPEVAIIDLESNSGKNVYLVINAPEEAGEAIDLSQAIDSSVWLNYSSVRSQTNVPSRSIYARVIGGTMPDGLRLRVKPRAYSGSGDGKLGVPAGSGGKVLVSTDRKVIKNIKTCYTGDGSGNGHQLVYSLEMKNNQYRKINFSQPGAITVLYTTTDN